MTQLSNNTRLPIAVCVTTLFLCLVPGASSHADTTSTAPPPCSGLEYRQFDFWLGTWALSWEGGTGTNVISSEMGGCVIEENFTTSDDQPFVGNSLSVYDARSKTWKQTWVDNSGGYLDFEGGMVGDSMILARSFVDTSGTTRWQRMVFFNIEHDSLDWHWMKSTDGKTWELAWAIHYTRQK